MGDHVALLRGINVGQAKRVPMADLRRIALSLGFSDPATIVNSGNLVFGAGTDATDTDAETLRAAVRDDTGVDSEVVILTADAFRALAEANPLRRDDREPKRLGVAFAGADLDRAAEALVGDIAPEELV
ncbi:MAG: hypothetical protein JWP75_3104, partial [Frondihabitans sp.]|nr:hypothetical protein [Frondihabitans sp.]